MAEWSNAAVLKTVEGHTSGGSNPSFSAHMPLKPRIYGVLFFYRVVSRVETFKNLGELGQNVFQGIQVNYLLYLSSFCSITKGDLNLF